MPQRRADLVFEVGAPDGGAGFGGGGGGGAGLDHEGGDGAVEGGGGVEVGGAEGEEVLGGWGVVSGRLMREEGVEGRRGEGRGGGLLRRFWGRCRRRSRF